MKSKIYKDLILIFIMSALYMVLEGLWRGCTNISMLAVGGLCAFLGDKLNEHQAFYNRDMWEMFNRHYNYSMHRIYKWFNF